MWSHPKRLNLDNNDSTTQYNSHTANHPQHNAKNTHRGLDDFILSDHNQILRKVHARSIPSDKMMIFTNGCFWFFRIGLETYSLNFENLTVVVLEGDGVAVDGIKRCDHGIVVDAVKIRVPTVEGVAATFWCIRGDGGMVVVDHGGN